MRVAAGPSVHAVRQMLLPVAALALLLAVLGGGDFGAPSFLLVHAYNPHAYGPSGAFGAGSGSSAQGGRGTDRYGNTASDAVTGQGAAANPYAGASRRRSQQQQEEEQPSQPSQPQPKRAQHVAQNIDQAVNQHRPVISGERGGMDSRYSNSFSAFGDTVPQQHQQPQQQQQQQQYQGAAPLHPAQSAPPPEYEVDEEEILGETTTAAAATAMDMRSIRIVTRRGGVQKPPGYVRRKQPKQKQKQRQSPQSDGNKANDRPLTRTNRATAAAPVRPIQSQSSSGRAPRPVMSGDRATLESRYTNSFSAYGSTAPAQDGPRQSSRARQLVGEMLTPASPRPAADGRGAGPGPGPGSGAAAAAAADGMRPVISGDRASMDNRYANSISPFGTTAPAPPTIVQQQRAARQGSAIMPRAAAPLPPPIGSGAGGGNKARVVKKTRTSGTTGGGGGGGGGGVQPRPVSAGGGGGAMSASPPPRHQQPPPSPVDDPNRPVISGDRGSLDNRYSNSISPFTNESTASRPIGGGGRKPTDGPFPSVVRPPPPASSLGGKPSGGAEMKKRKPMIIPRGPTPPVEYAEHDEGSAADDKAETAILPTTPVVVAVTHNGDRAGDRKQNTFSAFGDTPAPPVIGGARTDDRYGNSYDSSGNVNPPATEIAAPPTAKTPSPAAAVMNGERAGDIWDNSLSAFGETPPPAVGGEKTKRVAVAPAAPPKKVFPTNPEKPVGKKPETPKAIMGGARVENIYGNSLSAFGEDLAKKPSQSRRKPAARFAASEAPADKKTKTGGAKTSTAPSKKDIPKAVMNGARADDIYFNSFNAFGADVTKTPKTPRQATRPAKRVPAAYTGNPDITVSQEVVCSGSSASNEQDRYGNSHHVYNSHVHALKHQEPIDDDADGTITKKDRKWAIP